LQSKGSTLTHWRGAPSPQKGQGQQPWAHPRKTRLEMGGVVSRYPSCSGRNIHPINNGREDTPSDLTCVKFEKILRLAQ
ncbi:hypothetical protein BHE74_00016827, partial [Ensete ventricosum]